jgi:hypothetical protein
MIVVAGTAHRPGLAARARRPRGVRVRPPPAGALLGRTRIDFDAATPEAIAAAIAEEIGREVDSRRVETDGAAVAAARIAELL